MINLSLISKKFGSKTVLKAFSYSFNDYGLYAVTGKSGSGKTTLLNIIAGISMPTEGKITYSKNIGSIHQKISYIYQNCNLFDNLTVIDNINLIGKIKKNNPDNVLIDDTLARLGIKELKNEKISDLSGGERQRVSIGIALIFKANVIIADEPTSSLDENNINGIMKILKELSKEILVIISTHNKQVVDEYCDFIIDLDVKDDFMQKSSLTDIQNNIKQPFYSTSLKTDLIIKSKIMKKQKIRIVYGFVIFFVLLTVLSFGFSITQLTKTNISANAIEDLNIEGFMILPSKNQNEDSYFENNDLADFYNVSEMDLSTSDLSNQTLINSKIFARNIVINPSMNENEICLTDYSCTILKEAGIVNYENTDELIGTTLNCLGTPLKITSVEKTTYLKDINDKTHFDNFNYVYLNCFMSRKTFIDIFGDKRIDSINTNGENLCYSELKTNLTDDEIGLSAMAIEYLFNDESVDNYIGKTFDFTMKFENFTFNHKFKILKNQELYLPTISLSDNNLTKIYNEFYGFIPHGIYHTYYYATNWNTHRNLLNIISSIFEKGYDIEFYNYPDIYYLDMSIQNVRTLVRISTIIMVILALIFIIYLNYNMRFINRKNFQTLRLYGISKFSLFKISVLDLVIPLFSAALLSCLATWFMNNSFDKSIASQMDFDYNISSFSILACLLSFFIVLTITLSAAVLSFLFKRKLIESSYIRND